MRSAEIRRTGEPQRIRALGEGGAIYQVPLNAGPDRVWRSLFLDQKEYDLDFVPILVRFTYHPPAANFQAEESQLKRRLRLLDAWIESTNCRVAPPRRRSRTLGRPPLGSDNDGSERSWEQE